MTNANQFQEVNPISAKFSIECAQEGATCVKCLCGKLIPKYEIVQGLCPICGEVLSNGDTE